MSRGLPTAGGPLADEPLDVTLSAPQLIGRGVRDFERCQVTIADEHGPSVDTRDVLRYGRVVGVLPVDPARDAIVLIQQFRLAAHLANGRGLLIEIVAGSVEAGEQLAEAARRECIEETGVAPAALIELFTYRPTPGISDEEITLFLGVVDSSKLPERAGAAHENETTRPFAVPIDAALAALERRTMRNGTLIMALQWLALNRARLGEILRRGSAIS